MDENRKKSIDNLVNELKGKYNFNSLNGLKQLAKDREIYVIESEEITISRAVHLTNGEKYILLKKDSLNKFYSLSHELGHHLLFQINPIFNDETGADYFSEQLLNKKHSYLRTFADCIDSIVNHPISAIRDGFISSLTEKKLLQLIKNYKQQNGKI